jgi:hypothetical protein
MYIGLCNIEARPGNNFGHEKSSKYWTLRVCICMFALLIRHAKRTRHIVISGLSGCTKIFHIISHTERFSEKKVTSRKMCYVLDKFSLKHFCLRRIRRDVIINVHTSLCEVPRNIARFQLNFNFLERFPKNNQISNLMKIRGVQCGRRDRRMDGQTDTTKIIVASRNFAKAPTNKSDTSKSRANWTVLKSFRKLRSNIPGKNYIKEYRKETP